MKKQILFLATVLLGFAIMPANAQSGSHSPKSPGIDRAVEKLFGDNKTFSAAIEFQTKTAKGELVTLPGNFCFDNGKSRFEMDMTQAKGASMPAGAAEQMKAMGMDKVISISRPDEKFNYIVYPGLNSYVAMAQSEADATTKPEDFSLETTELGKETVDGHACVKNKAITTDKNGNKTESTVWNATDLDKFPVKIETTESSQKVVMHFKNISLKKPAASQFDIPSGLTKYNNLQTMMQAEVMKKMGGGMGMPPR